MKRQSKATVKTPVKDLKTEETLDHRKVILLEDIQTKMELVIEGMESTKESLTKKIGDFEDRVDQRFDMIECVVREHSGQLQNIEKQLADHGKQLADHGKLLAGHGERLDRIETKIDKIGERLDDHEDRIVILEKDQTVHP